MKSRLFFILMMLATLTLGTAMTTGCYTKVVRDDSVEAKFRRATGASGASDTTKDEKNKSWWE